MQPKSPLPWKWVNINPNISDPFSEKSTSDNEFHVSLKDANGGLVLTDWFDYADDGGIQVCKEDALFIEKAVNNHQRLLKMCKVALIYLNHCDSIVNTKGSAYPNRLVELIQEIEG